MSSDSTAEEVSSGRLSMLASVFTNDMSNQVICKILCGSRADGGMDEVVQPSMTGKTGNLSPSTSHPRVLTGPAH